MKTTQDNRFTPCLRTGPLLLSAALLACAGETAPPSAGMRSNVMDTPPPAPVAGYEWARHGGNYMYNYYLPPAPSSTPWAPAWSSDGTAIAVGMSGSIWSISVDLGAESEPGVATELTRGAFYHSSPAWSPDGRWMVYTADNGASSAEGARTIQLEILDVESGETRALTDDDFVYADPTFSPDGTRLAYVSTEPNGYFNVYVRPVAGGHWSGDAVAVTSDSDFGRSRLYFGPQDMHISPAWLPNGEELLLVSNRDTALGSGNVIRVPAESGGIERRRTVLAEQTLYRARPDVSLDGRRFVYSSTSGAADQYVNLYVQPTGGGEPYKMTFFEHDAFHPRWSPDGKWIAFVLQRRRAPAARAPRDVRRGEAKGQRDGAPLEGADGHARGEGPGRGNHGAHRGAGDPDRFRRQGLGAQRRLCAHRWTGGLPGLPHGRELLRGASSGPGRPHGREGLRALPAPAAGRHRGGGGDPGGTSRSPA